MRHHHERVDGGGYPSGLRGNEIPAAARIVGACDAYAAMTQPRPYRASLTPDDAIVEMRRNADAQFDAEVVEALVWLLDSQRRRLPPGAHDALLGREPARRAGRAHRSAAARSGILTARPLRGIPRLLRNIRATIPESERSALRRVPVCGASGCSLRY